MSEPCEVCGGDCAAANPPVYNCPLLDAQPGDTPSADGTKALYAPSLNTSSLPQIPSIDARVKELETALDQINRTCHTPTGPNQKAYTHFARDFDKIRSLCRSALSQGSPGQ